MMAKWSATDFIHQRIQNERAAEQLPGISKWVFRSVAFYLLSALILPILAYLILTVLIP